NTTEKATTTERPSETQPASDDIPEIDPSLLKGGDLIGSWKTDFSDEYEDFNMEIIFKPNGKASASLDISDELSFKNGKAVFDGTPVAYEFDGRVISISIEDYEFIKLERTSGSGDSLDGTYKVVIDENSALNDLDYYEGAALVIKGESVYALYEDMYVYTTSGNQLEMYIAEDEDHDTEKVTYGVIGDKLYVYADGETSVFTRTDH
ncbi:MAG: hypothetical protein IKO47_14165, partial [Ruminococcus sp.]|nr:hypothetical protein [Ruminococcus sp.]